MENGDQAEPLLERLVYKVAQGIASETGMRFFGSLVENLAHALPADFVFAGALKPGERRVTPLAAFGDIAEQLPGEFDLAETPFQDLKPKSAEPFSYPVAAAERFPNDPILSRIRGDGFVGAPLVDSSGKLVGLMSAITRRRLEDAKLAEDLVRLFAVRAAAELERTKQFEAIERQNAELRRSMEDASAAKLHGERDIAYLRDEIRNAHPAAAGNSPEFRAMTAHIRRVATTSGIVLIQGETGTGKELAARAIHNLSSRRGRPLVKLDCPAIPSEAVEFELFGSVQDSQPEGSPRIGRLDFANGGTLLIDEVAELPLETQAKLLRFIQTQEFRPLGFPRTIKADVRLLLTTNRDLDLAVREGRFRPDLYERLLVDPIHVPPLRRRRLDIPLLAERFLSMLGRRLDRKDLRVSERMMSGMFAYAWPGNIRELEDVLYRAALAQHGELDHPVHGADENAFAADPVTLEAADRRHVERTLALANWVIEGPHGAAAALNVPPSTLRSLMKRLGIQRAGKSLGD